MLSLMLLLTSLLTNFLTNALSNKSTFTGVFNEPHYIINKSIKNATEQQVGIDPEGCSTLKNIRGDSKHQIKRIFSY